MKTANIITQSRNRLYAGGKKETYRYVYMYNMCVAYKAQTNRLVFTVREVETASNPTINSFGHLHYRQKLTIAITGQTEVQTDVYTLSPRFMQVSREFCF